jgi:hypothetical protein
MSRKNIHEMNAASAGIVAGAARNAFKEESMEKTFKVKSGVAVKKGKKSVGKPFTVSPTDRKVHESASERTLREAIRKIIFHSKMKYYEEKGQQYLQEQKLRTAIRTLLKEEEDIILDTTGKNYGLTALERILSGVKNSYSRLTSAGEQRANFLAIFRDVAISYLKQLTVQLGKPLPAEAPKPTDNTVRKPVVPGMEPELAEADEQPEQPEATAQDPEVANKEKAEKARLNTIAGQAIQQAQAGQEADVTGAAEAYSALRTALPQLGDEFKKLSTPQDRKDFETIIFGDGKTPGSFDLTMQAVEKELNAKVPSTAKGGAPVVPPPAEAAPEEEPIETPEPQQEPM